MEKEYEELKEKVKGNILPLVKEGRCESGLDVCWFEGGCRG